MTTSLPVIECQCEVCKGACTKRPGWFLPGQVAVAARHLGMTEKQFFDKYVGVDYWDRRDQGLTPLFVLAPATAHCEPGVEYPFDPHGRCVFYVNEKCAIHPVKPHECAFYDHGKERSVCEEERDRVTTAWSQHQDEIVRLLGREPHINEPDLLDMLGLMMSKLRHSLPREMVEEMDRCRQLIDEEINRSSHGADSGDVGQ